MDLLDLLFSFRGRTNRGDFWYAVLLVLSALVVLSTLLSLLVGDPLPGPLWIPLYILAYWSLAALAIKRYHDVGRSGSWLLLLLIPLIGPAWVAWRLFFIKGQQFDNRYGSIPGREELDYLTVGMADRAIAVGAHGLGPCHASPLLEVGGAQISLAGGGEELRSAGAAPDWAAAPHPAADDSNDSRPVINDVTGLNPVRVLQVVRPRTVEELRQAIAQSTGPISVGGGRFSMGGQTASPDSLHIDMRSLNRVLMFSPAERWIRVQAGARWCDLQRFIDPHDLSIKIMQTYANFTVGGSLSVNSHGRYLGLGPLILSVRGIKLALADGRLEWATPSENSELFYGSIGCYGALGVIVEVELDLADNCHVQRVMRKLPTTDYVKYFREKIYSDSKVVFHNGDLYPPHYSKVLSQTWIETSRPVTQTNRLRALRSSFPLERYGLWAITETRYGAWRREYLFDPLLFFREKVHWRNYEAGYDVAELEPASRLRSTYVLHEYFVPVERFAEFVPRAEEILNRFHVKSVNISIRHAHADPGSLLAWARQEVFCFVLYYKQGVTASDREKVGVWTRELVDAALDLGGAYYLPYQVHPTAEQFHRAYPRAGELFALKRKLDPQFRFRHALWNAYYAPALGDNSMDAPLKATSQAEPAPMRRSPSHATQDGTEFRQVYGDVGWSDKFYRFLQNIYHLYPEDKFHALIKQSTTRLSGDKDVYLGAQAGLPGIKPFLGALTYSLPALKKQKREMARQMRELLGNRPSIDGYVEIGSTGRYVSELRKHLRFIGPLWITNDAPPSNSPADIMERGQLSKLGTFFPLDYRPLDSSGVKPASIDLVSALIGLHHAPDELLDGYVRSIHRVLRPGGLFIMRDHNAGSGAMDTFCSLAHTVFNLGLGMPWDENAAEFRHFRSADEWTAYLVERGFSDSGQRILQDNDPTDNTLMCFVKTATGAQS